MERKRRVRLVFAAMVIVGIIGAGISLAYGLGLGFAAFCGVVGIGALVVLTGGEQYIAPLALTVGVFAALLAVVQVVQYDSTLLGLLFAALALVAFARGYQYYRAYSM